MATPCHSGTRSLAFRVCLCTSSRQNHCRRSFYSINLRKQTNYSENVTCTIGNFDAPTLWTYFLSNVALITRRSQPMLCHRSELGSRTGSSSSSSSFHLRHRCFSTIACHASAPRMLGLLGEVGLGTRPVVLLSSLSKTKRLPILPQSESVSCCSFYNMEQRSYFSGIGSSFYRPSRNESWIYKCDKIAPFASISWTSPLSPLDSDTTTNYFNRVHPFAARMYATRRSSASHYYDLLGLTPKATQNQIKSAYYKMSMKYHPDVSQSKKGHAQFTEITEAYEVLGNIQKRRMYDRGLLHQRDPRSPYNPGDMDFPGARARQSPFERGERPPPPRGRSRIYNFDEFYKQHYTEVRERRNREWNEYVKQRDTMDSNDTFRPHSVSGPLMLSLFVLISWFIFFFPNVVSHGFDNRNRSRGMYDPLHYPPNENEERQK